MISNTTNRNIYLMLFVASLAGLIYCVYNTIATNGTWITLLPILAVTIMFLRLYLIYRREVKRGNPKQ